MRRPRRNRSRARSSCSRRRIGTASVNEAQEQQEGPEKLKDKARRGAERRKRQAERRKAPCGASSRIRRRAGSRPRPQRRHHGLTHVVHDPHHARRGLRRAPRSCTSLLRDRVRRAASAESRIAEIRDEVSRLLVELNQATDRNIALMEDKIAVLNEAISTADKKIGLLRRETEKHDVGSQIYSRLAEGRPPRAPVVSPLQTGSRPIRAARPAESAERTAARSSCGSGPTRPAPAACRGAVGASGSRGRGQRRRRRAPESHDALARGFFALPHCQPCRGPPWGGGAHHLPGAAERTGVNQNEERTAHSIGIEVHGGRAVVLIPAGSRIPVARAMTFTTVADGQRAVEVRVVRCGTTRSRVLPAAGGLTPAAAPGRPSGIVGRFLVPGVRNGKRGEARIDIGISLDREGIIRAWGADRSTGHEAGSGVCRTVGPGPGGAAPRTVGSRPEGERRACEAGVRGFSRA